MKNKEQVKQLMLIISILIFSILSFLKIYNAYKLLKLGEYSYVIAFTTGAILLCIFLITKKFSRKIAYILSVTLYSFVSIVMFIDVVYFSYNNKYTTIANLNMLPFLFKVKDSVESINPLKYIWIVAGLPIAYFFYFLFYKMLKDKKLFQNKLIKLGTYLLTIIIIAFMIYNIFTVDFKIKYLKNENIIYHTSDIFKYIFDSNHKLNYETYLVQKNVIQDDKYGIANGRNVVIIQAEALQDFVIDQKYNGQEITPFLNSLKSNDSFYFNNYFYQVGAGNTADAEFTVNNSIYANVDNPVYVEYPDNNYYGLPLILKDNGYSKALAFHGFDASYWNREEAYVKQGFDKYYAIDDFDTYKYIGMGIADKEFLGEVVEILDDVKEPFYSFIITLSSHNPFSYIPSDEKTIVIRKEHQNTLFGNYLTAINYVDNSIENFFKYMKEKDLYENSIFIIYGDHFSIPNYDSKNSEYIAELIGHEYSYSDMFSVPLIIHIPGMNSSEKIDTVMGHVDVLPTLLHLLGINNEIGIMMGNDIFSVDENIVYEQMHVGMGSFISQDFFYYVSSSGINTFNKTFDLKSGEVVPITKDMISMSKKAINAIKDAELLIKNDLIIKP